MCPAMGHTDRVTALAGGFGQAVVARIAVDLQDPVEASEEGLAMFAGSTGGIRVDHAGWVLPSPGPIIAGQGPEIAGLGAPAPGIKNRRGGLVHEQFGGTLQLLGHPLHDRGQMEGGLADPVGQHRAVQVEAVTRKDLALTIQW